MTREDRPTGIVASVRRADGTPVQDARVLLGAGPSHRDLAALSNALGQTTLTGLEPGLYTVVVLSHGQRHEVQIQVPPAQMVAAEIVV
ncbi:carboxypeptidase-like regulatory domain-containing protein [Deinococcus aerophilus]|uniref:Carboxypeptidase regulatory-like domain-containing protein n=1 Tax=Deinococcus aerophilus TaxID=522488 RepID=A0ABQ2GXA3_9DEIO|nr:carboxypeptidase-like regulatory domain-containing protein [Deinococcus aerophilus]GGM18392.1 hypothetical protein GCM10010841_28120 [Deinococcus aerophilus]